MFMTLSALAAHATPITNMKAVAAPPSDGSMKGASNFSPHAQSGRSRDGRLNASIIKAG